MGVGSSVRSYLAKPLEEDKVKAVAEAGDMAAKGRVKVTLNVITESEILRMISETGVQVMKNSGNPFLEKVASVPDYSPIYDSPAMIVVSAETTEDTMAVGMNTANCACAAQNMLLAATELGLGSCYIVSGTLAFMVPEKVKSNCWNCRKYDTLLCSYYRVYGGFAPHAERHANPYNIYLLQINT